MPTGYLHSAGPGEVLCSGPLGSCVAVLIFDRKTGRGFMAHIMLPGKKTDCFANDGHDLKYAENAINALAALLRKENPNFLLDCETCVVGGANVLQKGNDHISKDNIASALNELKRHAITINKASVGGVLRRQIICDVATGVTMVTTGDCPAQEFYRFGVSLMGVSV